MTCAAIMVFSFTATKAQGILDKIDRATDKVNQAGNTADKTKSTSDKIMGFFGKKKKVTTENSGKTTIKITGGTFVTLKGINDKLQNAKGIEGTKMKFNNAGNSSIIVQHSGTSDDLLKILQKALPDIFSEKNIEGLDDGEIAVKIK